MSRFEDCTRPPLDSGAKSAIFLTPYFFGGICGEWVVISPEQLVEKCMSLARSRDLYLDIENGQIRLACTAQSEDGTPHRVGYIDRIEASRLKIDYDSFLDAVSADRGPKIIDGHYPVTDEIIEGLRKIGLRP